MKNKLLKKMLCGFFKSLGVKYRQSHMKHSSLIVLN